MVMVMLMLMSMSMSVTFILILPFVIVASIRENPQMIVTMILLRILLFSKVISKHGYQLQQRSL